MAFPVKYSASFPRLQYFFVAFIVLYLLSVLVHLGYVPLNGEEPRRALVSIEMLESGNFIRPTALGWEYYNKPPLYNWLIVFFMYFTGSTSEMAVRLPSLIFLLVWGICNYYIVKKILSTTIAALSSVFLLTSFDIYFWGLSNGGEIDIFYSFVVYLQTISIFYFGQQRDWTRLYLVSWLLCAIGFLTKGFPSLLFEGFTLVAFCAYAKSIRVLFKWQLLLGLIVFASIVGGYLYAYSFYSSPARLLANLLKESFNKSAFAEYSGSFVKKIVLYPGSFFKILLPWSLLLLLLFKKHRFRLWENPLIRFCILFILFNIPVYWLTGHPKMRYVYMFLPFCMIILAYIFQKFKEENQAFISKVIKHTAIFFLVVLVGLVVLPFIVTVNYTWFTVSFLLLIIYVIYYKKSIVPRIWYVGIGIVVLRLIYSLLFIPVRYNKMPLRYDQEIVTIARLNNFGPISIYKKPDILQLEIDLKISKLHFGSIPTIPFLAYQIPYYYYQQAGQLVKYDTVLVPNRNYIGFKSALNFKELHPHILYSFKDISQANDEIILFTVFD